MTGKDGVGGKGIATRALNDLVVGVGFLRVRSGSLGDARQGLSAAKCSRSCAKATLVLRKEAHVTLYRFKV